MTFWNGLAAGSHRLDRRVIDGVETRVLELGSDRPETVVCLHGVGGHLEAFARNVVALAEHAHVIAYDFPGHGYSAAPSERSYEIDGYVAHLDALLDDVGAEPAHLIGVSLGGWVAARFGHDQPNRVGRLVLVGTGGATYDETVMHAIRDLSSAAAAEPTVENIRRRLEWLMADPASVTDELVEARRQIYAQDGFAEQLSRVLCLQEPSIRRANLLPPATWAEITAPTMVVWGSRDRTGPVAKGREIASMLPSASLLEMPDAGHWPQFERAAAFNEAVVPFLFGKDRE